MPPPAQGQGKWVWRALVPRLGEGDTVTGRPTSESSGSCKTTVTMKPSNLQAKPGGLACRPLSNHDSSAKSTNLEAPAPPGTDMRDFLLTVWVPHPAVAIWQPNWAVPFASSSFSARCGTDPTHGLSMQAPESAPATSGAALSIGPRVSTLSSLPTAFRKRPGPSSLGSRKIPCRHTADRNHARSRSEPDTHSDSSSAT